jgi:hypothetical protein
MVKCNIIIIDLTEDKEMNFIPMPVISDHAQQAGVIVTSYVDGRSSRHDT